MTSNETDVSHQILALLNIMLQNADMGSRDPRIRDVFAAALDNDATELVIDGV
ncbi:hypothetical protein LCGC14_1468360 [marine sediment metagenome]|uniref:Uncharacterized protein n=1 Tax=marine sediment metagenome TaxID=412755 RepID=A0A0F9JDN0_9ZZZZ